MEEFFMFQWGGFVFQMGVGFIFKWEGTPWEASVLVGGFEKNRKMSGGCLPHAPSPLWETLWCMVV